LRYFLPILIFVAMVLAVQPKAAVAGTITDCEKIKAADAYNQCLASYGPVAHEHELKPVPAGIGSGQLYHSRHSHYAHNKHSHSDQKTMELSVAPDGTQD
jgi:hypothetical protein